jgi:hypothetical protein
MPAQKYCNPDVSVCLGLRNQIFHLSTACLKLSKHMHVERHINNVVSYFFKIWVDVIIYTIMTTEMTHQKLK